MRGVAADGEPVSACTAAEIQPHTAGRYGYTRRTWRHRFLATTPEYSMERVSIFIRNSRERITPKRGRTSSRNLVWIGRSSRQLLIRAEFTHQIGDNFFRGSAEYERTLTVDKTQKFRTVRSRTHHSLATGRLAERLASTPDSTGVVHLFHARCFRLFRTRAGRSAAAYGATRGELCGSSRRAQHQLVADKLGVGRCLLQSGEQVLASTHVVTFQLTIEQAWP